MPLLVSEWCKDQEVYSEPVKLELFFLQNINAGLHPKYTSGIYCAMHYSEILKNKLNNLLLIVLDFTKQGS